MNVISKDFPDADWRSFKSVAARKGVTVKKALNEAVNEWTEKHRIEDGP